MVLVYKTTSESCHLLPQNIKRQFLNSGVLARCVYNAIASRIASNISVDNIAGISGSNKENSVCKKQAKWKCKSGNDSPWISTWWVEAKTGNAHSLNITQVQKLLGRTEAHTSNLRGIKTNKQPKLIQPMTLQMPVFHTSTKWTGTFSNLTPL